MDKINMQILAIDRSIEQINKSIIEKHPIRSISLHRSAMPLLRCRFAESLLLRGHTSKISSLSWCRGSDFKSTLLASTSQDGSILLWDTTTISLLSKWYLPDTSLTCSLFEPASGDLLCVGSFAGTCYIYKSNIDPASTGQLRDKPLLRISSHEAYVSALAFVDLAHLATASGDKSIRLWDLEKAQMVSQFAEHEEDVMCVDVQGDLMVSGSCDRTAKLWDIRQTRAVRNFNAHLGDVNAARFISEYTFLTGSADGYMRLMDMRGLNVLGHYNAMNKIECIEVSYSGRVIFTAGEGDSKVWDIMNENNPIQVLPRTCRSICLDSMAKYLAGCEDEIITLWQHVIYSN